MDINVPPQNLEAERAVIGAILIDNEVIDNVLDIVDAKLFYDPKHEILFESIENLHNDAKAVDVLTLTADLKKRKKLKQSGGSVYISEIISVVPTSANVKNYAEIVREMAIRRNLISFGGKLTEKAREEKTKIEEIMDELEGNILSLSRDSAQTDFYDAHTLLEMQMAKADEYAKNPDGIRGLPTGLNNVDNILGGLHSSDLVILAARPSVGKSAFACHLARHIAVEEGKSVAIFSLEMPAVQVMERMLAQQIQVDLWSLRMGKMKENEYKKYSMGAGKIAESKLFINDTPGITIPQLRSKARKLAIDHGLDMIVIDYLQLMQTRNIDNRAQAVGEVSRALKILARELNIPIVTLSQLNRSIENRSDRIPQLSDLRESGSIEQDADLVMFLSRDIDLEEETEKTKVDLHIAKHRNGPIGKCSFEFLGGQQRFIEVG